MTWKSKQITNAKAEGPVRALANRLNQRMSLSRPDWQRGARLGAVGGGMFSLQACLFLILDQGREQGTLSSYLPLGQECNVRLSQVKAKREDTGW